LSRTMKKTCEHVGKEHPMFFQCMSCDDTADECNCNTCGMVFCEKCQDVIYTECDDIREAWYNEHPDLDMQLEKLKIQGFIKDYHSSEENKIV